MNAGQFCSDGCTWWQLRQVAARLVQQLHSCWEPSPAAVLLLADERPAVAAALFAALTGGPALLLPHGLTATALLELTGFAPDSPLLTDRERSLPPELRSRELRIPAIREIPTHLPAAAAELPQAGDGSWHTPCVRLYTGGSTGRPQLWSKTPANLLGEARFLATRFGIGSGDRILATVPPFHIYGLLFSVLLPLVSGAEVVAETPFVPREVTDAIHRHSCTVLVSTPAHYRTLVAASALAPGSLRLAFSSGAPLSRADASAMYEATGIAITEVYGSTETGGIALRRQPLGETAWQPLEPVRHLIRDERLCVASPFLSPELPRDPEGYWTTGDRARPAPSGFLLLGRADGVVKVGGKRVDLVEVEERLKSLPGVEDALVLAEETPGGRGQEVLALVVSHRTADELHELLRPLLLPQAMPRRLCCVEQLPLTPTGKRDRAAALRMLNR